MHDALATYVGVPIPNMVTELPVKSAPEGRGQSLETLPDVEMSEPNQMVRLVRRMGGGLSQQRGKDVQEWQKM